MTIQYNCLNIENQELINEKAKTKKDGVYTLRGIKYVVKDKRASYFAVNGEIIQPYGHFNSVIRTCKREEEKGIMEFLLRYDFVNL